MLKRIAVLGTGLVGRTIVADLAKDFEVTACDLDAGRLASIAQETGVSVRQADLSDSLAVRRLAGEYDLVVGALPGRLGQASLRAVLEAGRDTVDISFFPEPSGSLDALARENGCTAVVDCGLAPGMSNAILGHHVASMARVDRFQCLVGGLPQERNWPFSYKAPFSPSDVIEEYTRPARLVENGSIVVRPALSEIEMVDFEGIGTLEAFNTDGLRTLLDSYSIPWMSEKTLRYPGHAELMRVLRHTGLFSEEPVELAPGLSIRPLDLTSRLLFRHWQLRLEDPELTVMRIRVEGIDSDGASVGHNWTLEDRYDPAHRFSSMARTTGFACTAAVHLVASGRFRRPGINPPERLGESPDCFRFLLEYQRVRNVRYQTSTECLS